MEVAWGQFKVRRQEDQDQKIQHDLDQKAQRVEIEERTRPRRRNACDRSSLNAELSALRQCSIVMRKLTYLITCQIARRQIGYFSALRKIIFSPHLKCLIELETLLIGRRFFSSFSFNLDCSYK